MEKLLLKDNSSNDDENPPIPNSSENPYPNDLPN